MNIQCVIDKRRTVKNGLYPVKIRLTQDRKVVYHSLNIEASEDDFDERTGLFYTDKKETKELHTKHNRTITRIIAKCNDIVLDYETKEQHLSAKELKELLSPVKKNEVIVKTSSGIKKKRLYTIKDCFDIVTERKTGRTRGAYKTTLKWITQFFGDKVYPNQIDEKWLEMFDHKLATTPDARVRTKGNTGMSVNARSAHMKNLRAVFNHAIKLGIVPQNDYPFKFYTIKYEHTVHRAMPTDELRTLFSYIPENEDEVLTIDICKMIFFAIGISFIDLYNLDNFQDETLVYKRAKTGRMYNIYIHPELRVLLDKYDDGTGKLKFTDFSLDWLNRKVNDTLKYICEKNNMTIITTYWMRHSWATYASKIGVSREDIVAGLGHGARTVTDIYIDYDMERVKLANRKVIDYVLYPDKYNAKYGE